MAIVLNAASAKLKIDKSKAVPDLYVFPSGNTPDPVVNAHLTNKYTAGTSGPAGAQADDAFSITGTVNVTADPGDAAELAKWHFGFLQFQKINALNLYYNGAYRSQGGLLIAAHHAPGMSNNPGRDHAKGDANKPFVKVDTAGNLRVDVAKGLATSVAGDHPMLLVTATRTNNKTGNTNYLAQLVDNRDFVTAFVARDPAGTYHFLSHVEWTVIWNYTFTWKGGMPIKTKVTAGGAGATVFDIKTEVAGKPTQKWVQKMLADPSAAAKLGTDEQHAALKAAANGGPPNREDCTDPIGHYPDNFYKY
ncbi:MAG TPA: hypothetical protein VKD90_11000 [Gemmataceae bacterium]|nr:hypothetical protein [Gemmataceae bacterium]